MYVTFQRAHSTSIGLIKARYILVKCVVGDIMVLMSCNDNSLLCVINTLRAIQTQLHINIYFTYKIKGFLKKNKKRFWFQNEKGFSFKITHFQVNILFAE